MYLKQNLLVLTMTGLLAACGSSSDDDDGGEPSEPVASDGTATSIDGETPANEDSTGEAVLPDAVDSTSPVGTPVSDGESGTGMDPDTAGATADSSETPESPDTVADDEPAVDPESPVGESVDEDSADIETEGTSAQTVVTADNYAPIARQAFRLMLDVFGPGYFQTFDLFEFTSAATSLQVATIGPPVSGLNLTDSCEGGGEVNVTGDYFSPDYGFLYAFDECATASGVADGSFLRDEYLSGSPGGGNDDTYDLALTGFDAGEGPGDLTIKGIWSNGNNETPIVEYSIERFSIADSSGSLTAIGDGGYRDTELSTAPQLGPSYEFGTTTFDLTGTALGIDQPVRMAIERPMQMGSQEGSTSLVVITGSLLLTVEGGGGARLSASDTPEIATVELLDAVGVVLSTDLQSWENFF